jgi:NAD(P)-dependent dehydrogenase (short-subunit alcohol dehydrogenase family)
MRFEGKNAIVTGSTRGIGREIALLLAREGAKVVVNGRGMGPDGPGTNMTDMDAVVEEIRAADGVAVGCAGAVQDFELARKLVETCYESFGSVDILVNNAGVPGGLSVEACPPEYWNDTIGANLSGSFYCAHHAVPHMKKQRWGRILNCGSWSVTGRLGGSCYPASKAGLSGLTRAMAYSLGSWGITTNCYWPDARTAMTDQGSEGDELFVELVGSWHLRGWISDAERDHIAGIHGPEGVAPFVVFLCTEEADSINGCIFNVEAGRICLLPEPDPVAVLYRDVDREGPWSLDELSRVVPRSFGARLRNPQPKRPQEELDALLERINAAYW